MPSAGWVRAQSHLRMRSVPPDLHTATNPLPRTPAPLPPPLQVIHCIENGLPLLIENVPQNIDPVLDAVIQRRVMKRGRSMVLKLGDAEVEYNPRFRLYLQTKVGVGVETAGLRGSTSLSW